MADDFMDEKVGVAVAASAVVFSPKVRSFLHRGAVLGVSGVLVAADMVAGFLRGLRAGVTNGAGTSGRPAAGQRVEVGNGSPAGRKRRRPAGAGVS
jgi:hypothetical protein